MYETMIARKHPNNHFFVNATIILILFSIPHLNHASPISFHFDNFEGKAVRSEKYPRDSNLVSLQGEASVDDLGVIDLTATVHFMRYPYTSSGRVVYSKPMRLWDNKTREMTNFTTEFFFLIDTLGHNIATCGDGFAFFLSSYPSVIPPGAYGASLGLRGKFVAIEFDTFANKNWEPEPAFPHIGIRMNASKSVVFRNLSSKFIDGLGYKGRARVSYDANTHNLSVFLLDDNDKSSYHTPFLSYVINLQDYLPQFVSFGFSASMGSLYELHRILSWSFTSTMDSGDQNEPKHTSNANNTAEDFSRRNNTTWFIVSIVLACGIVLLFFIQLVFVWYMFSHMKKRGEEKEEEEEEFEDQKGPKMIPYIELSQATGNFAHERILGKGGSGIVYEGTLRQGTSNLRAAIKRISKESSQGKKEYLSEVNIISRLSHRNLVKLLGWCHHEEKELLVVYEFLPNGSLDLHLFNPNMLLSWPQRHKVVLGLASALLYLHESCENYVVHRDIKSSNVLLDESFEAKLGDFGLARLVEREHSMQTTIVAGTRGYIAPECFYSCKFSKESDVFAFGIVILEIVCGKRCIFIEEEGTLVLLTDRVSEMYGKQRHLEVVDERLKGNFDKKQVERVLFVGMWCAQHDFHKRPSIRQASAVLKFEKPMPNLPTHFPPFSMDAILL